MLEITIHSAHPRWNIPKKGVIETIAHRVLSLTGRTAAECRLSVVFIGDTAMRRVNKKTRGVDTTTDVLSFPLTQTRRLVEGEIFISVPKARRQSVDIGQTVSQELLFLFVHGFLHILGYDHEKSVAEERRMNLLQRRILRRES